MVFNFTNPFECNENLIIQNYLLNNPYFAFNWIVYSLLMLICGIVLLLNFYFDFLKIKYENEIIDLRIIPISLIWGLSLAVFLMVLFK